MQKGTLYDQPTGTPTRKVAAAAIIGAPLATIIVWLLGLAGVPVPAEVAAALAAILAAAVGFYTRERWIGA